MSIVSEEHSPVPKRIVICCDGTWQSAISGRKSSPSNVTRLYRDLAQWGKDANGNTWQQILWYDSGIGTESLVVDKLVQGTTGLGLDHNIRQAYTFIAENYSKGDQIFCFGFSRGAYTARCIAGFISDVGVCERGQLQHLPEIWELYKQTKPGERFFGSDKYWAFVEEPVAAGAVGKDGRTRWKTPGIPKWSAKAESREIEVVGVFDTVGSLGLPAILGVDIQSLLGFDKDCYHNVALNRSIKRAFHALALDEHRQAFSPTLWRLPEDYPFAGHTITKKHDEFERAHERWLEVYDNGAISLAERRQIHAAYIAARDAITRLEKEALDEQVWKVAVLERGWIKATEKAMSKDEWEAAKKPYNEARTFLSRMEEYHKPPPELLQVWFPGMHLHVGGGDDAALRGEGDLEELSNITFAWMLDQIHPYLAIDHQSTSDEARARQERLDALNAEAEAAAAARTAPARVAHAIQQWLRATQGYDGASPPPPGRRRHYGWGTGPLVDSYTPLYRLNGSAPRTPGAYFGGDAGRRTRERVHPVVGWRMHATRGGYRPVGAAAADRGRGVERRRGRRGWEYAFPGGGGGDGPVLPEYRMRPGGAAQVLAYAGCDPALEAEDAAWYRALAGRPSFERLAITDVHPAGDAGVDPEHLRADEHAKAYVAKLDRENGYCSEGSGDGKALRCSDRGCE